MKIVAITGGIGSGKSAVRHLFEELGAWGIDADELARQVVEPGSEGARLLGEAFGPEFFDGEGRLNRKKMAREVFAQPEARRVLEGILHPLIRAAESRMIEDIRRGHPHAVVVVEVPLLAESGRTGDYDGVVLVKASEKTRITRLVSSGKYSEDEAAARMATQAADREREGVANWVVDNEEDLESTAGQVRRIYRSLTGS